MKKISEMSLEELQDHALKLEGDKKTLEQQVQDLKGEVEQTNNLNKQLQKRNNDMFVQLEQQATPGKTDKQENEEEEQQVPSCEEFAKNYILGGNK